jgi:hypothetical protein
VEEIYDVRALIPKIFAQHKEPTDSVFFPFSKAEKNGKGRRKRRNRLLFARDPTERRCP